MMPSSQGNFMKTCKRKIQDDSEVTSVVRPVYDVLHQRDKKRKKSKAAKSGPVILRCFTYCFEEKTSHLCPYTTSNISVQPMPNFHISVSEDESKLLSSQLSLVDLTDNIKTHALCSCDSLLSNIHFGTQNEPLKIKYILEQSDYAYWWFKVKR